MSKVIRLMCSGPETSGVMVSGPENTLYRVCLRKPVCPDQPGPAASGSVPFLFGSSSWCCRCACCSPGALGLARHATGAGGATPHPTVCGASWLIRRPVPSGPEQAFASRETSSIVLFLKDASWVCFQLSKFCHSKVFLLTQKPQGEVWRCFSLSFEGQRCSPLPCASSGTSQKSRCPASVRSALLVSQRHKIRLRHISAAPEGRFCK